MVFRIGIISDTHGLLRPEAVRRLSGVDHIVHGGRLYEIGFRGVACRRTQGSELRGSNTGGFGPESKSGKKAALEQGLAKLWRSNLTPLEVASDSHGTATTITRAGKQPYSFSKRLYKLRWRVESAFNRLKVLGSSLIACSQ